MITGDDKLAALVDASMFVLPSYSENFGIAVAEDMACGLPVVISDAINIWPEVECAETGLVGPYDIDITARNIMQIFDNPARASELGRTVFDWFATDIRGTASRPRSKRPMQISLPDAIVS
jgi:glycosyltransferase involved in cell wall biosynthesis